MSNSNKDRHIISILLDNEAGALSRVAGLFSARGYNIESLTVAVTENPQLSRMTIVTFGVSEVVTQVINQLNKLIDVVEVRDLSQDQVVEREMLLVKIRESDDNPEFAELEDIAKQYGGNIIHTEKDIYLLELAAPAGQVENLLRALQDWHLLEVVRSGVTGLSCGAVTMSGQD